MRFPNNLRAHHEMVGNLRPSLAAAALIFTASVHATTVLYDQTATCSASVPSVQPLNTPNFTSEAADDFTVPAGQSWGVTQVYAPGVHHFMFNAPAQSVNVQFFANAAGIPGAAVAGCAYSAVTTFTDVAGALTINLPSVCVLTGGNSGTTYWVGVQPVTPAANLGIWYWSERTPQNGYLAQWQNPPLGWNEGCATWGVRMNCNLDSNPDQCFSVSGNVDVIFKDGFGEP
jgi:hypothetical protein